VVATTGLKQAPTFTSTTLSNVYSTPSAQGVSMALQNFMVYHERVPRLAYN
jgi:hypothetical protein